MNTLKVIGATAVALALSLSAPPRASGLATNAIIYQQINTNVDVTPFGQLTVGPGGYLFGLSESDPVGDYFGGIFCLNPSNGVVTILHLFDQPTEGSWPYDGPAIYGTNIFGTTEQGGSAGAGTLFKFALSSPTNGTLTVLYNFGSTSSGTYPLGQPITPDGVHLYGSLPNAVGDANDFGGFYCVSNSTLLWETLVEGTNGANPSAALAWGKDGYLYGTTEGGGDYGAGTIGRLSTNGEWTMLYSFSNGPDGQLPLARMTLGPDGLFYGTTAAGNLSAAGAVFRFDPVTGSFETIHTFLPVIFPTQAARPLIVGPDGALYGSSQSDGTYGTGQMYRVDTNGNFVFLMSFPIGSVYDFYNGFVLAPDNCFYQMSLYDSDAYRVSLPMFTQITNLTASCPDGITLKFPTVAGESYELDASTNLPNWSAIGTITATDGSSSMLDTNKWPSAFYRINQLIDSGYATNMTGVGQLPGDPTFMSGPGNDWSCFPALTYTGGGGTNTGTNGPPLP